MCNYVHHDNDNRFLFGIVLSFAAGAAAAGVPVQQLPAVVGMPAVQGIVSKQAVLSKLDDFATF